MLICLYRTPDGDVCIFLDCLDKLLNYLNSWPSYGIIIGGDINAQFDVTTDKDSVKDLLNLLREYNLFHHNSSPTRELACLDNAFSNLGSENVLSSVEHFPYSDHEALRLRVLVPAIYSDSLVSVENKKIVVKRVMNTHRAERFKEYLFYTDWENMLNPYVDSDAEVCFNVFFNFLMIAFNDHFPFKKFINCNKVLPSSNKWYNDLLKNLKKVVLTAYDFHKIQGSDASRNVYNQIKYRYRRAVADAKLEYNSSLISNSDNKCMAAWSLIKNAGCNVSRYNNNTHLISPSAYNNYFVESVNEIQSSIVKPCMSAHEYLDKAASPDLFFEWQQVTSNHVLSVIKKIKNSKSKDYYGLSNNILKDTAEYLAAPLALCTNSCLSQGIFPNSQKISKVNPVFKKGDKANPANFRPISLIPTIGKIIEHVVYKQVSTYLELSGLLSNCQYGFRQGRSTMGAIDALVGDILTAFEEGTFAWGTFCDLTKAFDCVEHDILINKLHFYGIHGTALKFFQSYLHKRRQTVCVDGEWSPVLELKCGVPQGSVLGPLLFLIAINDLPFNIPPPIKSYLYADDTSFLLCHKDINLLQSSVAEIVNNTAFWFSANNLLLNNTKTQSVIFSLRDLPNSITSSNYVNFLGVTIDRRLSWAPHIDRICTRLSRVVFLLRRLMDCVPSHSALMAYYAFFQSIMGYGLIFWGGSSRVHNVLLIQKKVIRILAKAGRLDSCKPLFIELKILTIVNLYIYYLLLHVHDDRDSHTPRCEIHHYETRYNQLLNVPFVRLCTSQSSHRIMGLKCYNCLPNTVKGQSANKFKKIIMKWLIKHPFYTMKEFFAASFSDM